MIAEKDDVATAGHLCSLHVLNMNFQGVVLVVLMVAGYLIDRRRPLMDMAMYLTKLCINYCVDYLHPF